MNSERRLLPNRRAHTVIEFEHAGLKYVAGVGRFDDYEVAEVFLHAGKVGSHVGAVSRVAAVILSIALQHGAPLKTIRHALTRLRDGSPAGPIGMLLDLLGGGDG